MSPSIRGRGLHLLSGLKFYSDQQLQEPQVTWYRLSIPSIFGFVALTQGLSQYWILDKHFSPALDILYQTLDSTVVDNCFSFVPNSPKINVSITMPPETLSSYPPTYFQKPAAQVYTTLNPDFAKNGHYIAVGWKWTPANILNLQKTVFQKLLG